MLKKKIIIAIHGIGNKPNSSILKKWWLKSIADGFEIHGYRKKPFFKFELAYWTDLIYATSLNPKVKDKKSNLYIKRPYAPPVACPVHWAPSKLKQKILDRLEKNMDKLFFEDIAFLKLDLITDLIMRKLFKDLDIYYNKKIIKTPLLASVDEAALPEAKYMIRQRLAELLRKHKNKQILLLSHSMGTVIALDVLMNVAPEVKVHTFMTMGSPLGLPIIKKKIIAETKTSMNSTGQIASPENILKHWYNISDLDDKIAVNYDLEDDYSANSNGVAPEDIIVRNCYEYLGAKNHHKSYGYLRTPEVTRIINNFIVGDKKNYFTALMNILSSFAKQES